MGKFVSGERNVRKGFFFFLWRCDPAQVMASSLLRFLDHTQRRTTVGRTPLDEWSPRRKDLYLTTHNKHNRQTSIPPVGFEPTITAGKRPQTYALDRAATGTGTYMIISNWIIRRMRNISQTNFAGKKAKTHISYSIRFCRKSCHLWDNGEKYCGAGQAT